MSSMTREIVAISTSRGWQKQMEYILKYQGVLLRMEGEEKFGRSNKKEEESTTSWS